MKKFIPHLSLALGLIVLAFFVLDRFNDVMAFMTSDLSKWYIAALALTSIITSICLIAENIKAKERAALLEEKRRQRLLEQRRHAR